MVGQLYLLLYYLALPMQPEILPGCKTRRPALPWHIILIMLLRGGGEGGRRRRWRREGIGRRKSQEGAEVRARLSSKVGKGERERWGAVAAWAGAEKRARKRKAKIYWICLSLFKKNQNTGKKKTNLKVRCQVVIRVCMTTICKNDLKLIVTLSGYLQIKLPDVLSLADVLL